MSKVVEYVPKVWELPSEGMHQAVVHSVDFIDDKDENGEDRHRVRIKVETDQMDTKTGNPLSTLSTFTRSMHENSYLRKAVRQMLGTDPGLRYDLDLLIGLNLTIMVEHVQYNNRTFANVSAFSKARPDAVKLIPSPIVAKNGLTRSANSGIPKAEIPDNDIPF